MKSYLTEPNVEFGEFVRTHLVAELEPVALDAFVETIARDWVIVVRPSGETVLAACVQHDQRNPDGASEVVLLGCSDLDQLEVALEILLGRAEQIARNGTGRRVDLQVPTPLGCIEPKLEALGFSRALHNVDFELGRSNLCHAVPHRMPNAARWQDLDEGTLAPARGCYQRAFGIAPHALPPALTDYGNHALMLKPRARLLVLDEKVLAFVRVVWKDRTLGVGEVRNLGRDPDAPQRGLGALALVEALRSLGAMGARRVMLTAASCNQRGIALYRAFGFAETQRRAVFRKHLPP